MGGTCVTLLPCAACFRVISEGLHPKRLKERERKLHTKKMKVLHLGRRSPRGSEIFHILHDMFERQGERSESRAQVVDIFAEEGSLLGIKIARD